MIIGESRPKNVDDTILAREVTLEKTLDGRESLKITVKASRPGGQESSSRNMSQPVAQARPVRPASSTGQTGQAQSRPRTVKPKGPEVRTCKVNESRVRERVVKQKPTFDQLLNKYKKDIPKDRPVKKISRSPLHQGKPSFPRGGSSKHKGDVTTKFPPQSVYVDMPWVSSASDSFCPTWGHEGVWM